MESVYLTFSEIVKATIEHSPVTFKWTVGNRSVILTINTMYPEGLLVVGVGQHTEIVPNPSREAIADALSGI